VIYLASKFESGEKSGIREIAEFIDASEHTVGKMLQILVKENVINSSKGPSGGFFMSAKQTNQHIINIIEAIDGEEVFRQCAWALVNVLPHTPVPYMMTIKR
jgi:DNA-binding IscR family transcriptional regulator